jgi:purine-cytosine permease-like protein
MGPTIAVFIPIIGILVIGIVLVSYFFFRSRERQLLIEKGLDAHSIKEFFESKKDPFRLLKIGIITIAFGLGVGLGVMMEESNYGGYWVPLFLFTITGIGFVVANVVSRKLEKNNS